MHTEWTTKFYNYYLYFVVFDSISIYSKFRTKRKSLEKLTLQKELKVVAIIFLT
jgi:hypothetical protein